MITKTVDNNVKSRVKTEAGYIIKSIEKKRTIAEGKVWFSCVKI